MGPGCLFPDPENNVVKCRSLPAVLVVEPHDVVLFQVLTQLHFDDFEWDDTGVFQPVLHPGVHERALAFPEQAGLPVEFDLCRAPYYNPVLAPVMMELQGESLSRLDRDPLDLVIRGVFEHRVRSPWPVDLPVELCHRVIIFVVPADQILDLFRMPVIADEEGIDGVHNHKVADADEPDMLPGSPHEIVLCQKILGIPDITFRIMGFGVVEGLEGTEVTPVRNQRDYSNTP